MSAAYYLHSSYMTEYGACVPGHDGLYIAFFIATYIHFIFPLVIFGFAIALLVLQCCIGGGGYGRDEVDEDKKGLNGELTTLIIVLSWLHLLPVIPMMVLDGNFLREVSCLDYFAALI